MERKWLGYAGIEGRYRFESGNFGFENDIEENRGNSNRKTSEQKQANKNKRIKTSEQKQADKKSAAKIGGKKTVKTEKRLDEILQYMKFDAEYKSNEIADEIGLQLSRTRDLLKILVEEQKVITVGEDKNRRYKKCKN